MAFFEERCEAPFIQASWRKSEVHDVHEELPASAYFLARSSGQRRSAVTPRKNMGFGWGSSQSPKIQDPAVQEKFARSYKEFKDRQTDEQMSSQIGMEEIRRMAARVGMQYDDVNVLKRVFDVFDVDGSGTLDPSEFEEAVRKLLQLQLKTEQVPDERVRSVCDMYWFEASVLGGAKETVKFIDFLHWYEQHGFTQEFVLSEDEQLVRKMAKKHGVSTWYVDRMKRCFDNFDEGCTGEIDFETFKKILHQILQVPTSMEIPPSRLQHFWAEIDIDNSGKAVFEEFLQWWLKYFEAEDIVSSRKANNLEDFYKIRRVGEGKLALDPPPYQDI